MKKVFLAASLVGACVSPLLAADTTSTLEGMVINEFLPKPDDDAGFDSNNDGSIQDNVDEFLELYNTGAATVDITGWEFHDAFALRHVFGSATIDPGGFAVVIGGLGGGSLPTVGPGSFAEINSTAGGFPTMFLNNDIEEYIIYDPDADEFIHAFHGPITPMTESEVQTHIGSPTATRIGTVEDFGTNVKGVSFTRNPDGDTNIVTSDSINSSNASPGVTSTTTGLDDWFLLDE